MAATNWLIYGATGYTGRLIAREALERGLQPILAGRSESAVRDLASELALDYRVFSLDNPEDLRIVLRGMAAVLHCAGPFVHTSRPMVEACLATGAHYLDITGELSVFEGIMKSDGRAREAGVALVPGVGFDVVPTDCLAARLAQALPGAVDLRLAFATEGGSLSRGTLRTGVEGLPHSGAIRRNGDIVPVPVAFDVREIDFEIGPRWAMTIPWGDVSTAFHSTGIPNIRVYAGAHPKAIRSLRRLAGLLPVVSRPAVKSLLSWWIGKRVAGPSAAQRAAGRTHVWGEVTDAEGRRRAGTLSAPDAYSLTASAAVESLSRVLSGDVAPGSWTPSRAFGESLVDQLPGVVSGAIREETATQPVST